MRCEKARELLPAYVLGSLGEKGRSRLESHLLTCSECAAEARQGLETMASLVRTLPEHSPSPTLRAIIMRSLPSQVTPAQPRGVVALGPSRWTFIVRQWWLPATAGALAVMAIALIINTMALRSRIDNLEDQVLALPTMEQKVAMLKQSHGVIVKRSTLHEYYYLSEFVGRRPCRFEGLSAKKREL